MSESLLPKNIAELKAYSSAKSEKLTGTTWLNANESPYAKEFQLRLDNLNRYPEPQPENVINAYCNYAKLNAEQVLMTRGADEGIELLMRTYCESGKDSIALFAPTYGMYKVSADTQNIAINELSQSLLLEANVSEICDCVGDAKLVFVCNPNNPTGSLTPVSKIAALAKSLAGKAIVVVDEAYIEFCPEQSAVSLLQDFDNVAVLRTLSKAFALAGLRTGFLLANANLLAAVRKVIAPYPVSTAVAMIAEQALSSDAVTQMRRQVSILNGNKARLETLLNESPKVSQVLSGEGNFVTLQLRNKDDIDAAMQQGTIMRPFTLYGDDNWLRISIGNEQELEQVRLWLEQPE
ncbi:histidinol-phosphate transaminase [Pseudoalteromonas luteoviolacea]|uniref:histidinol-phosphate transaminase n=1 Tax=Pseudoalteromonas luteoviolacea TaxID=43657 RepID=A0A1C0TRV7_9GAMM|nr:histidinol-phosphate transaminase [Pseudoalteromonas luteoviolacea]OCQ21995.1 histidinol-phosphate transaminase [Pseudoalteromonas luteoviolacea]